MMIARSIRVSLQFGWHLASVELQHGDEIGVENGVLAKLAIGLFILVLASPFRVRACCKHSEARQQD